MAAEASEPVARAYKTLKAMSQNEEVRILIPADPSQSSNQYIISLITNQFAGLLHLLRGKWIL